MWVVNVNVLVGVFVSSSYFDGEKLAINHKKYLVSPPHLFPLLLLRHLHPLNLRRKRARTKRSSPSHLETVVADASPKSLTN